MKKNTVHEYIFAVIAIIIAVVFAYVLSMGRYYERDHGPSEVYKLSDGWTLETKDGISEVEFPLNIDIEQGEKVILHYTVDQEFSDFHLASIRFYRYYVDVVVSVDGREIARDVNHPASISNTSGTTDMIFTIPYDQGGKVIDVELTGTINGVYTYNFPVPELGEKSKLFTITYASYPINIIFDLLLIAIGLVVFVISIVFRKEENSSQFLSIGLFSLFVGTYLMASSRWFHSIIPNTYFAYVLEYTCFTIAVWPVLITILNATKSKVHMLARLVLNYQITIFFYNYISLFVFNVELSRNLVLIQLGILLTIVVVIVNGIVAYKHDNIEAKRISISFAPLSVGIVIDLLIYYFFRNADALATFSMIGILFYIILRLYFAYDSFDKNRREKERAEIYRQLAFTDPLTGVSSRLAYEEELKKIENNLADYENIWAATVDVNDLKIYNDSLGHFAGDAILKSLTTILADSLREGDHVFRVGGDEFVLFMKNYSEEEIDEHYKQIRKTTDKANKNTDYQVKYAVGYCKYDPDTDEDFNATIHRSDTLMYRNKNDMKENSK